MLSSISFLCVVLLLLCSYGHIFSSARDTLTHEYPLIDDGSAALVSAGGEFSLGFFTPTSAEQGSSDAETRYVGIWYHGLIPTTVIWIANRDVPIPASSTGVLTIEEGNICVLDNDTKKPYWSASIGTSRPLNTSMMTVMIMDSGNLVLSENGDELTADPLWQSFQYPTDTFIPGMLMDASLELTSWSDVDDPRTGNYTFLLEGTNVFTLSNNSVPYWKREDPSTSFSTDEMHPEVAYMLLNFSTSSSLYTTRPRFNYTRLVIDSLGVLNGLIWNDTVKQWDIFFTEPKDQCSFINPCGYFGNCNIDNSPLVCKCLPGFIPQFIENWKIGDFSSGCTRQSSYSKNDTFLSIKVKRAGKYDSSPYVTSETECKNTCLGYLPCRAYSFASAVNDTTRRDIRKNVICYIWTTDLNNLVEDSGNSAKILNARVSLSDLESTSRDCQPACGTTTIPYPLSIASSCGDPMYLSFVCNTSTSDFFFNGPDETSFKVINISQSTQRFIVISKKKDYCDSRNKKPNISYPFKVISWCKSELTRNTNSALNSSSSASVIEMGWEPPLEPSCNKSVDCKDWPNSTCSAVGGGKEKCLCNKNFQWSGVDLSCNNQEANLQVPSNKRSRRKLLVPMLAAAISGIILSCIVGFCIWRRKMTKRQDQVSRLQLDSERRVKELIDTSDFNEEADKGIDVPFFDLQSILDATNNFSFANKLGQGGYGPVYKGIFPGGQEIAVKRLSKVSGQGLQEFKNEVVLIAKLQHRNLVRLRGYCMKGEEKILLYEYMPNKSLDSFIFGLVYLHQDSRLRIVHRDLKTSNVLLDEEMNPKISDFGLARIVGGKETEANTNTVVGTYGYMSPEYALDGNFSFKSDVFSFGVVLLEIISGKKNAGFYQSRQTFSLLSYTWGLWIEDKVLDLMDKNLEESCNRSEFVKCVNVGLLCVPEDPVDRPTMSNVATLLDSEAAIPAAPKQPAFFIRRVSSSSASTSTKPDTTLSEITTVQGR